MDQDITPGTEFARALAAKDFDRIEGMFGAAVDFRGLTPNRTWEAGDPATIVSEILRQWFEESDEIRGVEMIETDSFANCERVGYRFRVEAPDGEFLVEQQAYLEAEDGRINWMRVVCSGFRPV